MPEHVTWFAYLPGYDNLVRALQSMSGPTWLTGTNIDLQHSLGALLVAILLVVIALLLRFAAADEKRALVPEDRLTLRNFIEVVTEIVLDFMEEIMGKKAARYFFPLIGTCAFFILFSNLLGFIPGLAPPTSNLNTTAGCSIIIFISTHVFGVKEHGIGYFAEFFGPIRKWYALPLMLFMFVVEIIGHVARPVSLSFRLMGNMFADHAVATVFLALVPVMPFLIPLPVMLLGLLVCIVQTMVFILLSMVYIGSAVSHAEH
jgi:F-type H+-transporting ATPase subunit a